MHFGALRSRFHQQSALCSYVTGPIEPFTDAARIATLSLSSFRGRAVRPNVPGLKRVWGVFALCLTPAITVCFKELPCQLGWIVVGT